MNQTHEEVKARHRDLVERGRQDYAQRWDFNEVAEIVGVVESIEVITFKGDNGEDKPTPVVTIRDEFTGERRSVWLSQAGLFNKFRDLAISPGESVYVRYLGEADHHERGKSPAKRFRVEVDRVGQTFDWSRFGGPQPSVVTSPGQVEALPAPDLSEEEHKAAMAAYAEEHAPVSDDDIPF